MKLLELYEDLFQYICRLNRAAKIQAHPDYRRVRGDIQAILEAAKRSTMADVQLRNQVEQLELPLVFFVDNLIAGSRLKIADQWGAERLATERGQMAGDQRFFQDFLDKDIVDPSPEATERLAVFYMCLGLGFTGMYQNDPERIRGYMARILPRIRPWMDLDPRTKISEEAYQNTDTRVLTEPPSKRIVLVAIVFVFLSLSVLAVCYALYANAVGELEASVKTILTEGKKLDGK